ncbi:glycoside hydrolase family 15 protein [Streptomyces camelliae]|uniref:Glycoside hydrolase family 15 protein n=1 Tax=Streptomyces camelliae TaxID=3004093 RepID=A0ABY7PG96_9ACTN|nr:glycoside hydrolase family 15 protein [Streptomyces sp. HUAS 2-6]WBO67886.1 glycoside hydrolase family 15 protein [Streptomyces sp. HUAS 2-6]
MGKCSSGSAAGERPERHDGYAPLREYAAIGDGRTVALVARDGAVDWLPVPDLDSPTVFTAVLDSHHGGSCTVRPTVPWAVARRYLPGTNVLETTFTTALGTVRVTDAMTVPDTRLTPMRELQRRVDGLSGSVPIRWSVTPRFGYGSGPTHIRTRAGAPVASCGADAVAVCTWQAGRPQCTESAISGHFETRPGSRALIALSFAHQEPLILPSCVECDARLVHTCTVWRRWLGERSCGGPWQQAVERSALALKLLDFAPSGTIAAAATSSLPEQIGGIRNWDYRYSWIRDSAFTLDAFLRLGCAREAHAYFWWLMHATQLTHPRLRVLYRLDGGARAIERTLPLQGYQGSAPPRIGNAASDQLQLDTYGELLQTAWLYAQAVGRLDADVARRVAEMADLVCRLWREPDAGIWEVRSRPLHFTQSKMMCWVALDRATRMADLRLIPARHADRWRRERQAIRHFIETRCFSDRKRSYTRTADSEEVDASLLLGLLYGYAHPGQPRLRGTVEAIRRELAFGPFVHRYSDADGLPGSEGAFLACSFWLAEALADCGRVMEAADLMDQLITQANDVGLYSEEIDPADGTFLGNLPQALSHLALISAACALTERDQR